MRNLKFKILVACHKPSDLLKNESVMPIHVGRAVAKAEVAEGRRSAKELAWMTNEMPGDDTGDNISDLNGQLCEMTALYWAWKNYQKLGNPDYVGLMHYRRHFIFDPKYTRQSKNMFEMFVRADDKYLATVKADPKNIAEVVGKYDFAITDWTKNAFGYNNYKQFKNSPGHIGEHLDRALSILEKDHPSYAKAARDYMQKEKAGLFCNMFVAQREIFFDYCEWIFGILFKLHKTIDYSELSINERRSVAFIAERLTAIYFYKRMQESKKSYLALPITFLDKTDQPSDTTPFFKNDPQAVSICFSSDNNYAPYLGVAVTSLIQNASAKSNYDIFILDDKISPGNKALISSMAKGYKNISLRFVDIHYYLSSKSKKSFYVYGHFTMSTYLRFFAPLIFSKHKKILYLDSDLVINKDVAELFHTPLEKNLIGASKDLAVSAIARKEERFRKYMSQKLELKQPSGYFQAGVIILNIEQMIKENIYEKLFDRLSKVKKPIFVDQCIMNSVCQGRVKYFDGKWNVNWYLNAYTPSLIDKLSAADYQTYQEAGKNPYILHYAGDTKPWQDPLGPWADNFWRYARATVFYEAILTLNSQSTVVGKKKKATAPQEVEKQAINLAKQVASAKIDKVAVYGAGIFGKSLIEELRTRGVEVDMIVDSSTEMHGVQIDKTLFCSPPKSLLKRKKLPIVVASAAFSKQITNRIKQIMGAKTPKIFVPQKIKN